MRTRALILVVAFAGAVSAGLPLAAAQQPSSRELAQAKSFFNAGAAAYEMGDYAAAIQALEAAYRITPLPAVAFSLAQAERRQYFVSRERAHLERAIELYRVYLRAVETGGRRADATDALAQLEPLAALSAPTDAVSGEAADVRERTRVMISSPVANARVSLDGGPEVGVPFIARVPPGTHRVVVRAQGHFPAERSLDAVEGELVPIEVALREQPASVVVRASPDSDLHVDGAFMGRIGERRRIEQRRGQHELTLSRAGYQVERRRTALAPGETRELAVDLRPTAQRTAAIAMFIAGGGALLAGVSMTGLAVDHEADARKLDRQRQSGNITAQQLRDYAEAKHERDRWRGLAVASYAISLGAAMTGLFLYFLDEPNLRETKLPDLRVDLPAPGSPAATVTGRLRF
jgi:tetratricopeptide (TPR) repeat protein